MKRLIALFSLLLLLCIPSYVWAGTTKVIRVAGDNNFPPFEYLSDEHIYTGFNVDVMNALSIQEGVKIEYHLMPWNQALQALRDGKVDAIQGMKYSSSRDKVYDFSIPYFKSSQAIFVLKNNVHIHHLHDLAGSTVVVQKGDISLEWLQKVKQIHLIKTDSQQQAIQILLSGKAEAFVGNLIAGKYYVQSIHRENMIKMVGGPFNPAAYGIAVLPKNKDLLLLFNHGLGEIKKNGTLKKIEQKWFGESIADSSKQVEKIFFYLKLVLAISVPLIGLVLWWNWTLKKEVQKRTFQIKAINQSLEDKMEQLEESIYFQQQLLDSAYSYFVTLDEKAQISMVNQKAVQFMQIKEPIFGNAFVDSIFAKFIPLEQVEQTLTEQRIFLHQETVWKDRILLYNLYPLLTRTRASRGVVINFSDITKRLKLEKEMAEADRLRALGQLTMGIAHEIRNPLTAILMYTELLPKKADQAEFRTFFHQQVRQEITRLNDLLNNLLQFGRPKRSISTLFSWSDVVPLVLQLLEQIRIEKNIQIDLSWNDSLEIRADHQQMQQVVMNIVLNALEASKQAGQITIRGFEKADEVVLEISDNGNGIPHPDLDKIFEPFFTTKAQGTGLGLAISYQLILENGGTIQVVSNEGQGTIFSIYMPKPKERR